MLRIYDKNNVDITEEFHPGFGQYCQNPSCLGEPWCSAWGICAGTTAMEPQQTSSVYSVATSSELSKNDELDIEGIFFELSKQLEQEEKQDGVQESTLKETLPRQRFAKPTSKEDLAAVHKASMPKRTQDNTAYCMKVWKEWRHCRVGKAAQENNPITSMSIRYARIVKPFCNRNA